MSIFSRLGLAAVFAAILLSAPLRAHEGHQDNMTDAEMLAMEEGMVMPGGAHTDELASPAGETDRPVAQQSTSPDDMMQQSMTPEDLMNQKIVENRLTSAEDLLARLHPVAVHFPIALLLVAALAEFALMLRPTLGLQTTIRFLVAGGAIGAVVAALLGWFAGGWRLVDRSENLAIHRWNGTTLAILSLLAWWVAARGKGRGVLRLLLVVIAAGLIVQGYIGGEMMSGPNHLGIM